jgi:predicted MPP superfamily phosphohydrolase
MSTTEAAVPVRRNVFARRLRFTAVLVTALALLFGVPWWTLVAAPGWPTPVFALGTLLFLAALVSFPVLMVLGHRSGNDAAAKTADTTLGVLWITFVWSLAGNLVRVGLAAGGVADPARSRIVAGISAGVALVVCVWGYVEAMRVPRIRRVDVTIPRLGQGLDGVTIGMLTDTHYGPIDRVRWSQRVAERVNTLDADILVHTGDIADGTVRQRLDQAAPLGAMRAKLARAYVTGNHEYFGEAQAWLDHMGDLGWEPLHNRHLVIERDGARLVLAGVDDRIAGGSGLAGHRTDHAAALAGADPSLPVVLLAHQPQMIKAAVEHDVDLQLSGHTHGGQIWPFHYLVRIDQPAVQGLTRHGERTQLYTSRGTGFWGPPFRVFAPSEITLLTLHSGH